MRRVIIESPFGADTPEQLERNLIYAKACGLDSLRRGEAPFASHLFYPQILFDSEPEERELGITAGYAWTEVAQDVIFYTDLGWSNGMRRAWDRLVERNTEIVKRFERGHFGGLGQISLYKRELGPTWEAMGRAAPKLAEHVTTEEARRAGA